MVAECSRGGNMELQEMVLDTHLNSMTLELISDLLMCFHEYHLG
jgi:hypothetical protein